MKKLTSVVDFEAGVSHVELGHHRKPERFQMRTQEEFLQMIHGFAEVNPDVWQSLQPDSEVGVDSLHDGWSRSGQGRRDLDGVQGFEVIVGDPLEMIPVDWTFRRLHL
jgi:hypothetical protein